MSETVPEMVSDAHLARGCLFKLLVLVLKMPVKRPEWGYNTPDLRLAISEANRLLLAHGLDAAAEVAAAAPHVHKWLPPHDCGDPKCEGTGRVVCAEPKCTVENATEPQSARQLLDVAITAMTTLHAAAIPVEDDPEIPALIPAKAFKEFVDAHAGLLYARARLPPAT